MKKKRTFSETIAEFFNDDSRFMTFIGRAALLAAAVFALIVKRLPSSRLWRRLVLKDASTSRRGFVSAPPRESLVGKRGDVRTELRPAGTALIDGKPVDVVSEVAFLPKGTAVRVIAVEGMRVVVRREEETGKR